MLLLEQKNDLKEIVTDSSRLFLQHADGLVRQASYVLDKKC